MIIIGHAFSPFHISSFHPFVLHPITPSYHPFFLSTPIVLSSDLTISTLLTPSPFTLLATFDGEKVKFGSSCQPHYTSHYSLVSKKLAQPSLFASMNDFNMLEGIFSLLSLHHYSYPLFREDRVFACSI